MDVDAGYLKNFGRYDFKELVPEIEKIDPETVRIYHTPADYTDSPTLPREGEPLLFLPWEKWDPAYDLYPWSGEYPRYITETPQGTYELYPRPDIEYILGFDFTRQITEMAAADPETYTPQVISGFTNFFNNTMLQMLSNYFPNSVQQGGS